MLLFASERYKTDKRGIEELKYIQQSGKLVIPIRLSSDLIFDGPLNFIPSKDCQITMNSDKSFQKISQDIILNVRKTLGC